MTKDLDPFAGGRDTSIPEVSDAVAQNLWANGYRVEDRTPQGTEEQHGRRELLGSTAIGRNAQLAATLLVILTGGLLAGLVCTAGLLSLGFPPTGSLLLGLVISGAGWVGAVIGAVFAQVTENLRAAAVAGFVTIMVLHFVRGFGHITGSGSGWLTMLSPSGWLEGVRPYAGDQWPMLLVVAGFVALLALAAFALSSRRDLGVGLLAARAGRDSASSYLRDVFGLVWRQNKASFVTWTIGFALIGIDHRHRSPCRGRTGLGRTRGRHRRRDPRQGRAARHRLPHHLTHRPRQPLLHHRLLLAGTTGDRDTDHNHRSSAPAPP